MKYIKVRWMHSFADEPIVLYSEVDDERWEKRKICVFRNGPMGFASATEETRSVALSEKPLPPLWEIAADPEFIPEEIDAQEFESIWDDAHAGMS